MPRPVSLGRLPRRSFIGALLTVICLVPLGLVSSVPRTDRVYVTEHALLPEVHINGQQAWIRAVRVFRYRPDSSVIAGYTDRTYDLTRVRRVWFGLSPFAEWRGPAHAFLSFEFADSQFLAVSVEARKEVGERYSPWLGMLRSYELLYVLGDEADIVGVRSAIWRDPVYLYPGRATPEQAGRLLEALLRRTEALRTNPEYYHTLSNNCATNLAAAVNVITPGRVRWNRALLLPGFSDTFAYEQGLLAIDASPAQVRERYRVDERARAAYGEPAFSTAIRLGLGD